ncbi:hypothetical protein PAT3040_04342 [Paenibacillus agaridevorans]|uniref:Haloacid dehalogenase n=1 Tax=Paenibacillus agaridevorans TaxID=171404 RepID=A0A2R5F0Q5_9BACL|nr:hypothetical protein [Paenibacillus agaridevorans]GBG09683.1 hypothetical protein PAT3040_04342 [Paenibacillus agaridevorans]
MRALSTSRSFTSHPQFPVSSSDQSNEPRGRSEELATRPQLVLDIGGVLAANLSPKFWMLVSEAAEVEHSTLYKIYKQEISSKLWRGEIMEEQFWGWLQDQAPKLSPSEAKHMLAGCLSPLPALQRLPEWSRAADLHILSNHLLSWVTPLLQPVRSYLTHIVISSEQSWKKPQRELFAHAASLLPSQSNVLFVDDQQGNLDMAETMGWEVVLADDGGAWIEEADRWIHNKSAMDVPIFESAKPR